MATKQLIKDVYLKGEDGQISSPVKIGTTFKEIVDDRSTKGNYTLEQFFDNYLEFMQNGKFIYYGSDTPKNHNVALWIDTSGK